MAIDVFLIDPDAARAEDVTGLLANRPDVRLCGAAAGPREALPSLQMQKPDVVLLDVADVPLHDLRLIHQIHSLCPHTRVLAVVAEKTEAYLNHIVWQGADGTVLRPLSASRLLRAVKEIHEHGAYVDVETSHRRQRGRRRHHRGQVRRRTAASEPALS